ncbi:MAG: sigma-54 dependent transcriptional regulator [Bacteroidales bacterium]|nr:sigma-54 dependent transcriptional regulator [Bacteroidales bacterium]HNW72403.1 sigma-54 dependent transcriptional regulator [Bacteroidales bacterium]HPS49472.1 sigma-54 dependent transcriptional regulator [Bacteroidales bacterium]
MEAKPKEGRLLIVDDNKSVLNALRILLKFEFLEVITLSSPNTLIHELENRDIDVVLLDMNFRTGESSGNEGMYWLREIKKFRKDIEVVMFTAYGDIETAVRATHEGAADFILKPWENEKLLATLKAALNLRKSNLQVGNLIKREQDLKAEMNRDDRMIIGDSPIMRQILDLVKRVAATDANIMITGENGTGKELIAKEIHRLSERRNELLVTVDLGSMSESLFESEMFGHTRGSFTDAHEDRTGKIMLAQKGTLLLDEIGNLPLQLQSKLLNVLQNRVVIPVGSNKEYPVDIRLISMTNKNLLQMIRDQTFRQDLLYRINTIQIEIPPLRERKEDIVTLAHFFIGKYSVKYKKDCKRIQDRTIDLMMKYPWPGNIRELQHTIEKAVILCDRDCLSPADLYLNQSYQLQTDETMTLEQMEKQMIVKELKKQSQSLSFTAKNLGISRTTLYKKMKKYGL